MDTPGYAKPTAQYSTTARFVDAAVGNAEGPRAVTAIEEIWARLVGLQEQLGHLTGRLQNIADRASGPVPQTSGGVNGREVPPSATLNEIFSAFDTISHLLDFAHEQTARIEHIA